MNERAALLGCLTHHVSVIHGMLFTLAISALMTSCDSHSPDPQLGWGWVTSCAGPEFGKFGGSGPGPQRPVFRVTDQLVVAVPKNYRPYAASIDREPGECRKMSDLPPTDLLTDWIHRAWATPAKPSGSARTESETPQSMWVHRQAAASNSRPRYEPATLPTARPIGVPEVRRHVARSGRSAGQATSAACRRV